MMPVVVALAFVLIACSPASIQADARVQVDAADVEQLADVADVEQLDVIDVAADTVADVNNRADEISTDAIEAAGDAGDAGDVSHGPDLVALCAACHAANPASQCFNDAPHDPPNAYCCDALPGAETCSTYLSCTGTLRCLIFSGRSYCCARTPSF